MANKSKKTGPRPVADTIELARKDILRASREIKRWTEEAFELRDMLVCLELFERRLDAHDQTLKRIERTNATVEETLLNVLGAIKQNEYLQMWYPAQKGVKAGKFTGPHPTWVEEKAKKSG